MSGDEKPGVVGGEDVVPYEEGRSKTGHGNGQEVVQDRALGNDDFPDFDQTTFDEIDRKYAEAEERWSRRVAEGRVHEDTLTPDD
ncbi:MAG: hypothetical protein OXF04_01740 [bacterium]|nr:hypothetical protein [bacterium]